MSDNQQKILLCLISLILAGFASVYFFKSAPGAFPIDDAYIHLTYAKNFASGEGFSFNPGEKSFGSSSPLWVFLLSALVKFLEPHFLVRLVSFFCLWLTLFLSMLIIYQEISHLNSIYKILFSLIPALFLSGSGNFLWISYSGMESGLWTLLCLAVVYFLISEKPSWAGYILLGLTMLCRLEAVLLWALVIFWQVYYLKHRRRIFFGALIALLIPLGFHLWAYFSLGSFFPITRAGKLASNLFNAGFSLRGGFVFLARHLKYLWITQPEVIIILLIVIASWILYLVLEKPKMGGIKTIGVFWLFALGVFIYHSQFFRSTEIITPCHNFRYQVLLFPAIGLGLAYAFQILFIFYKKSWTKLLVGAIIAIILCTGFYRIRLWKELFLNQSIHIFDVHQRTAKWCELALPVSAHIACFDIGSLGFYSGRYVIDLGGLLDPALHRYLEKGAVGEYLKEKKASHYIEMGTPGSERILGVRKDRGRLYELVPIGYFSGQRIREPVLIHSWEMKVFELKWLDDNN